MKRYELIYQYEAGDIADNDLYVFMSRMSVDSKAAANKYLSESLVEISCYCLIEYEDDLESPYPIRLAQGDLDLYQSLYNKDKG